MSNTTRKPEPTRPRAGTAPKTDGPVPRKHIREGSSKGPAPKRVRSAKYCKWCKAAGGLFIMHNTAKCRKFEPNDKQKENPAKPSDSARKPWKKGGGGFGWMAYLTNKLKKLEKNLPRRVLVTCLVVILTVTRIVGPVARVVT